MSRLALFLLPMLALLSSMKSLPGVTIDEEGQVSLRGSDKVAILIDGRQSSLTGFGSQRGLDAVSAANIEAIEIINNPSARFDAAGMAGIINTSTRRNSSSVGLATSASAWASASSRGSAATCRPIWAASRPTRRSRQAATSTTGRRGRARSCRAS
jgi:hypothetical protein